MHCQMIIAIHKAYKITMLCQTVGLLLTPDFPKLKETERIFFPFFFFKGRSWWFRGLARSQHHKWLQSVYSSAHDDLKPMQFLLLSWTLFSHAKTQTLIFPAQRAQSCGNLSSCHNLKKRIKLVSTFSSAQLMFIFYLLLTEINVYFLC